MTVPVKLWKGKARYLNAHFFPTNQKGWEKRWERMATTVDERGRVLIPRDMREEHGFSPGSPVIIESTADGVVLQPALPREEALRRLNGAINAKTRKRDAVPLDPLDVKKVWEPRA